MALNLSGYWTSSNKDGSLRHLYRVTDENEVYRFKNGDWELANQIYSRLGIDDDFDFVTDEEAEKIMKELSQ